MKHRIRLILKIVLAIFMIYGGIQHFIKPEFYTPFVPKSLPFARAIIYISGTIEIILGIALLIKRYTVYGAWGIFILMLLFLPIHIGDVFSKTPAIGSSNAAFIRLAIQFLLIFIAWKIKNNVAKLKLAS